MHATTSAGSHFPNKFSCKFSGTNVAQHRSHVLLHCLIDNLWTDGQLAPFGGIRNQSAHSGESCLVDKIDNELELVQTFEIGKLGRIAGANKGVEARTNQRARAATKHCLLAKKIGLGLLAKSRFEYTGTRAANSFRTGQAHKHP